MPSSASISRVRDRLTFVWPPPAEDAARTAFVEPGFGAGGVFRRRQPDEGEVIAALEMDTGLLEGILPLQVDQRRDGIWKRAVRIELRRKSGRLDEDRPAGAETAQHIVEPGGRADELGRRRAVEVRPPESRGPLERAVLVEDDARRDQRRPRQDSRRGSAVRRRYSARFIIGKTSRPGRTRGSADADARRRRSAGRAWRPTRPRKWPTAQIARPTSQRRRPEADGGRERAVDDGDRARRTAEQDRFGQRAMDRAHGIRRWARSACHQTSAPPPKEKNDRKKLDAAKAIDRPKTIWISRRKPPEVSPKASVRPVTMMMITATILATGPSIEFEDLLERLLPTAWRSRPRRPVRHHDGDERP